MTGSCLQTGQWAEYSKIRKARPLGATCRVDAVDRSAERKDEYGNFYWRRCCDCHTI